jgi:hypothetical protein
MKIPTALTALPLVATLAAAALPAHAEDDGIDPAKAQAFDTRVFAGPIGNKAFACFVRRYDASHLAHHSKQKIRAVKLLLTAENRADEPTSYAYKVGLQFRNRPGDFDGGSSCGHMIDEDGKKDIRFTCDAACGGSGLEIAMSQDNKSAIMHLDMIAIWDRKHPDGDAEALDGGTDDKVFRVDRADNGECAELLAEHKELASLQRK